MSSHHQMIRLVILAQSMSHSAQLKAMEALLRQQLRARTIKCRRQDLPQLQDRTPSRRHGRTCRLRLLMLLSGPYRRRPNKVKVVRPVATSNVCRRVRAVVRRRGRKPRQGHRERRRAGRPLSGPWSEGAVAMCMADDVEGEENDARTSRRLLRPTL